MKKIGRLLSILLATILIVTSIILLISLKKIDFIPSNYLNAAYIVVIIVGLILGLLLILKTKKTIFKVFKSLVVLVSIILIFVYGFAIYSLNNTLDVLENAFLMQAEVTNYYVVVLKNSNFEEISDLENKNLLYLNNTDSKVIDSFKLNLNFLEEENIDELKNKLFNEEVEAIIVSDIILNKYEDDDSEFNEKIRVLETISITKEIEDITKRVSIKNTPFNVLISGIDTYGDININSRNDVNMIATINPNTNQILLTSIPRDYYVKLHGLEGYNDKLTHASYYGINTVVKTIEDLMDISINYYVKVNFTTVVDLVDKIGGIEVYSDRYLYLKGCNIKYGMNTLDGKCALAFSRERMSYEDGDKHRGRNQQAVIEAIFKKIASGTTIISEYNDIISSLNGKFTTNMDLKEVSGFIKHELSDLGKYKFLSNQVDGYGSLGKTYSYPYQDLWIMIPYENTIEEAKTLINKVLNNEILENLS